MIRTIGVAATVVLLGACTAVGPDYTGSPPTTADSADSWPSLEGAPRGEEAVSSPPVADWWARMDDPALSGLMARAVAANYDLRVAVANVTAAAAALTAVDTRRRPSLDFDAEVSERRLGAASFPGPDPDNRFPGTSFGTFSLSSSWEIDLFGRVRRSIEAAEAELGSAAAVRDGVMVSVLAAVARAYVDLRGEQVRLNVAERNVAVQRQTLELVELLLREGAATELDRARAETQLMTSESTIPSRLAGVRAAKNRLTTLLAEPPGALDDDIAAWPALDEMIAFPDFVPVGRPPDLLRRRPDVIAAERALAAASARIGVATADLFPTVVFGANVGVGAAPLSGLTAAGAPFFSAGPALRWNLFDRRAIQARIRQADSTAAANLARYEATVTRALEETDTAINGWRNERRRRERLNQAVAASRTAAELARLRYREGVEDFLAVLDAQRSVLVLEDQRVQSAIGVAQRLIDIHLALGGGWQAFDPPAHAPYDAASAR
ncbi:MAG: efflux transporter outer membrane subunit [Gammaproteobacteria bacterium]